MADLRTIARDPDFQKLPIEEQKKAFIENDADFAQLPEEEQAKGIKDLTSQRSIPGRILHGGQTFASGFNKGLSGILGFPVSAGASALRGVGVNVGDTPVGSTEWFNKKIMPPPVTPENTVENYLQSAGEQIPGLLPGVGMGAKAGALLPAIKEAAKFGLGATAASGTAKTVAPGNELLDVGAQIPGGWVGAMTTAKGLKSIPGVIRHLVDTTRGVLNRFGERTAAKGLASTQTTEPLALVNQLGLNEDVANKVQVAIPGSQFTRGQKSNDPNLLATEAGYRGTKKGTAYSAALEQQQKSALTDYIENTVKGGGKVDDTLVSLGDELKRLESTSTQAQGAVQTKLMNAQGLPAEKSGNGLYEMSKKLRGKSSAYAINMKKNMDLSVKMATDKVYDKINDAFGSFDTFTQDLATLPSRAMGRMKKSLEPVETAATNLLGEPLTDPAGKPLFLLTDPRTGRTLPPGNSTAPLQDTLEHVWNFQSQMNAISREAYGSKQYALGKKASLLAESVDDMLAEVVDAGKVQGADKAIADLTDFKNYWQSHVATFRGRVGTGEVLRTDDQGRRMVVGSEVGKEYFGPGTNKIPEMIDSFNRTFKKDKPAAINLIRDYAAQDLLSKAVDGVTGSVDYKKVSQWLFNHQKALKGYGLDKEFSSIQSAARVAEEATANSAKFNASSFAKALTDAGYIKGAEGTRRAVSGEAMDVTGAIQNAFETAMGSNSKLVESLSRMAEIARKSGQPALDGMKAGIGTYLQKKIGQELNPAAANKFMESIYPAVQASRVYSAKELGAFKTINDAVKIAARSHPAVAKPGSPVIAEMAERGGASAISILFGHLGVYSPVKGVLGQAFRPILKPIEDAASRAMFDPQYADLIRDTLITANTIGADKAVKQFIRRSARLAQVVNYSAPAPVPPEAVK
jgi:hypothetical protein